MTMPSSVKQLLDSANQAVPKVTVDEARRLIEAEGGLLVDVRDATELAQSGKLQGALNISRGMIEFRADSELPYHNPEFRKERPVIVYCASGGRSALAGKALKDMGYDRVFNLGGFKDAAEAGFATEKSD
jgi:rhodanese-related sulfurtransferase